MASSLLALLPLLASVCPPPTAWSPPLTPHCLVVALIQVGIRGCGKRAKAGRSQPVRVRAVPTCTYRH